MYTFDIRADRSPALATKSSVPRVVYWVGLSSLLADTSAEMVASALPVFLFSVLQLSPLQVGFLDGLYQGGAAVVRVVAGYIADRRQSNRMVAMLGYAISTVSKLGLLLSGSLGMLVALLSVLADRIGKGIRTAPRDAIIAGHTPAASLGAAFGVHRGMDAAGALLGPLVGAGLLWWFPFRFDLLFGASFLFGALGLFVFRARVTEPVAQVAAPPLDGTMSAQIKSPSLGETFAILYRDKQFVWLTVLAVVLSAFTISDGLLYLSLQRGAGIDGRHVPLMFAATALIFLATASPLGKIADRFGFVPLYCAGYAVLATLYLWIAFGSGLNLFSVIAIVVLLGIHYAATDGVLVATAVRSLDARVRTTGLAVLATAIGLTRIASSSLYGWLWQSIGMGKATVVFAIGMICCCIAVGATFRWARK